MLLAVNIPAGTVKHIVNARSLAACDVAVRFCESFGNSYPRLLGFKSTSLAARQLAVANPLTYALLFMAFATIDVRCVRARNYAETHHEDG